MKWNVNYRAKEQSRVIARKGKDNHHEAGGIPGVITTEGVLRRKNRPSDLQITDY